MERETKVSRSVAKIEKWIFYFLCGYALLSSATIAGGNIFLGLATATAVFRLVKKHDDWKELLVVDKALRIPFFVFLAVLVVTSLFSTDIKQSADTMINHYLNRMMPFFLVLLFVRDKKRVVKLAILACFSTVINEFVCVLQWHRIMILRPSSDGYRPGGFVGYMMTAGMVSMWVPVLCLLFADIKKNKYIVGMALLIVGLGAIYNNTRGAWLAIAVTSFFILLIYAKSKIRIIALLMVLGLGCGTVIHNTPWMEKRVISMTDMDSNRSNQERLIIWKSVRNMVDDYPLTGVGYGCFADNYHEKYILPEAREPKLMHAHSNFFHILAESGYPGAVAVCFWWLGTLAYCIKGWYKYKNIGYLTFMAIFLGIMLQGATEYTMGDSIVMKLFWFGVGLSYQWIKLNTDNE